MKNLPPWIKFEPREMRKLEDEKMKIDLPPTPQLGENRLIVLTRSCYFIIELLLACALDWRLLLRLLRTCVLQ